MPESETFQGMKGSSHLRHLNGPENNPWREQVERANASEVSENVNEGQAVAHWMSSWLLSRGELGPEMQPSAACSWLHDSQFFTAAE